jgi:CDP-diacylglycerol--glycerol-3-phosphate 3-phosphatidyltransferase
MKTIWRRLRRATFGSQVWLSLLSLRGSGLVAYYSHAPAGDGGAKTMITRAAFLFAMGKFRSGAMVIFFAAFLDMLDGQVARREKRVTAFGAFFDSTLDRYSDMALYMGLLVYYAVAERTSYVVLSAVATAGSVMVSYSRARAESLIPLCKVGFMERPERMVLLILGGLFNRMAPALWVIAIVATLTVIHRILHTWQETKAGRTLPGIRLSL